MDRIVAQRIVWLGMVVATAFTFSCGDEPPVSQEARLVAEAIGNSMQQTSSADECPPKETQKTDASESSDGPNDRTGFSCGHGALIQQTQRLSNDEYIED